MCQRFGRVFAKSPIASRTKVYLQPYPEFVSKHVPEVMQMHRETERQQLRETGEQDVPEWLEPLTEGTG